MSRAERAKQFAPFAALKGYDDLISEMNMDKFERMILSEEDARILSDRLSQLHRGMIISVQYYDACTISAEYGVVSEVESALRFIRINKKQIYMDDIIDINGEGLI